MAEMIWAAMREFEGLDQPLLLEFRERALLSQRHGFFQLRKGFDEVIETLNPADVLGAHRVSP